ncbi:iron-siderophore ABC transporter substrate-binding protein [Thermasporomyces composti]|mgnify:CR=1 FL=1|uniref:Iron complex transport system substrate-binding protein n=1 Tax=Thermasporomyces composti TaxID=696763 RepID=A0A3D9V179_THECX|nr:iron-siderophore ABC transporter substrate-binding protein [Thermasporomyces composti]REF35219.1 iron complex transport system substrate-binding protein [Thermasporomyces composti]
MRDATGEVRLDGPARRVVALEWTYAENLLAVGVTPVGVAEKAGYATIGGAPRMPASVRDVGKRETPDLDVIRALKPDLIVTDRSRPLGRINALRLIAPVLVFDPQRPDMSAWEEMRTTFIELSRAVGRRAQAERVLTRLDQTIDRSRKALADVGWSHTPTVVAISYADRGLPVIRVFARTSLAGDLLARLGLQNPWRGRPEPDGLSTVQVADLRAVAMAEFLYVPVEGDDIVSGTLAATTEWRDLEFVEAKRVRALRPRTWFFGGPVSLQWAAEEIVRALT